MSGTAPVPVVSPGAHPLPLTHVEMRDQPDWQSLTVIPTAPQNEETPQ
jgi:hypothetical protein